MNKKTIFLIVIIMILLVGIYGVSYSGSNYSEEEIKVRNSVINTFDLKGNDIKPLFMRDVLDTSMETESPEVREKVTSAVAMLKKDNGLSVGDFRPMIFLKGKDKVLLGVKHPNNTITLTEIDFSKGNPVVSGKQVKKAK